MSRLQATSLRCFLGLVCVAPLLLARHERPAETTQSEWLGHTTAQQAITLSAPVFQALLPGQGDLLLSAEPHEIPGYAKSHHHIWSVDCVANQGADTVHLLRDADSGEILVVARDLPREHTLPVTAVSSTAEAVARARAWLVRLGYPTAWHLIAIPRHDTQVWVMVLSTDQRRAIVHLDAKQGYLKYADIRPL